MKREGWTEGGREGEMYRWAVERPVTCSKGKRAGTKKLYRSPLLQHHYNYCSCPSQWSGLHSSATQHMVCTMLPELSLCTSSISVARILGGRVGGRICFIRQSI